MKNTFMALTVTSFAASIISCSSTPAPSSNSASGGGLGNGGVAGASQGGNSATSSGGRTGAGGTTAAGGAIGVAGSTAGTGGGAGAMGGMTGPGGQAGGEAQGSGGLTGTGGRPGSGGTSAAGGASGGTSQSGGASGLGGTTGGMMGSGGVSDTGGKTGQGGAGATGGATATGGVTATGGSSGKGGSSGPVTTSCPGAAPAGITPDWCSCDQWGQLTKGDATYYNDIWGSGAGPQCIWVAGDQWGTTANHPSGGGVKSYPNISFSPGKALDAYNTYTSSFQITVPSGGAWEVAYDIWVQSGSTQIEIMLWVNYTKGVVFPASSTSNPAVSNVTTGGHAWDVYYGAYGGHDVISLLRTTNTNSATVDLKDIFNWLITNKKTFNSSWTLYQVQFGPEIVSDSGVQSFVVSSFSIASS